MKNINEKYAHLQRTSWPQYANTTLGHLPAEHYNQIEAAYDAQLANEAAQEKPAGNPPTPDIEMPVGDSMNSAVGTTSDSNGQAGEIVEAGGEMPSAEVSEQPAQESQAGEVLTQPSEVVESADVATSDVAAETVAIEGEKGQA